MTNNVSTLCAKGRHRLQSGRVNVRLEEDKENKRTTDCVDQEKQER